MTYHKKQKPNAVSYLILYILMSLFLFGVVYGFLSDIKDDITPLFSQLGALSGRYFDAETQWGFDVLNFLFSFSIVFFPLGLFFYALNHATKPENPYW